MIAQGPDVQQQDAQRYARIRHRLLLVDLVFSFVLLWMAYASGFSHAVAQ